MSSNDINRIFSNIVLFIFIFILSFKVSHAFFQAHYGRNEQYNNLSSSLSLLDKSITFSREKKAKKAAYILLSSQPSTFQSPMASSHSFYIPSPSMSSFSSLSATNSDYGGDITGKMPILPKEVMKYSQVPKGKEGNEYFTATTIPKGLLNKHSTKKGTWGVINVSKGMKD